MYSKIGLVLSCIDHRLIDDTIDVLKQENSIDGLDHIILAGASLGFNQMEYLDWRTTFVEHLDLAIKLHDIKKIIVVDHDDCGVYNLFYSDTIEHPYLERGYHYKNIRQCIKKIKELYPTISVVGYLLNIYNRFIKISES